MAPLIERAGASPLVTCVVGGLELLARGVHGGDNFRPPTQQVDHLAPPAGIALSWDDHCRGRIAAKDPLPPVIIIPLS
jgi:hypothetical protein